MKSFVLKLFHTEDLLPRFHVPFWLSHILFIYYTFVLAYVQARTEV